MVSGLVTSPCDQLRIFSGEASEMRMASKSVMGLVSSNGLERYKTTLLGTLLQVSSSEACLATFPGLILLGLSFPGAIAREDKTRFQQRSLESEAAPSGAKALKV